MNLMEFDFPSVDKLEGVSPVFNTIPELLAEAKARGFDDYNKPASKYFSSLFFRGGEVKFKEGIDKDFQERAWRYCRSFMRSWLPKHEDKTAICAMIMDEILDIPK